NHDDGATNLYRLSATKGTVNTNFSSGQPRPPGPIPGSLRKPDDWRRRPVQNFGRFPIFMKNRRDIRGSSFLEETSPPRSRETIHHGDRSTDPGQPRQRPEKPGTDDRRGQGPRAAQRLEARY